VLEESKLAVAATSEPAGVDVPGVPTWVLEPVLASGPTEAKAASKVMPPVSPTAFPSALLRFAAAPEFPSSVSVPGELPPTALNAPISLSPVSASVPEEAASIVSVSSD
jgi:hypothetical protein